MSADRTIGPEPVASQVTERTRRGHEMLRPRDLALDSAVRVGLIVTVTVLAVLYLVALYWLFMTSIKVPGALYEAVPDVLPRDISLLSWRRIFNHPFMPRWFFNSLLVATVAT